MKGIPLQFIAIAAGLLAGAAVLTVAAPEAASAAPAAPATSNPAAPSPVAPAPAAEGGAAATSDSHPDAFTKGTNVWFRNETPNTVWVREHHIFTDWYAADEIKPGDSKAYSGNYGSVDDVQLRIFRSAEDARENSVFKAIEVDAENPAWSSPWLSVSYQSKYYSVGTVHFYVSPIAGAAFTGQRHGDSDNYKHFELTMTKGWSS